MRILLPLAATFGMLAPLTAAQSTITLTPIKDTYLQDVSPNTNFGASTDIWFGRGSFFGLGNVRTLVEFDLTSVPPHALAIKSATFSAWQHSTEAAAGGLDCELHAATSPWTEAGATWNNQPAYDARVWDAASVGDSFYTGWIDWDATALVREHATGGLANLGWFFRMQFESAGASRLGYFYSSEFGADPAKRLRLTIELYDMVLTGAPLMSSQVNTLTVDLARPGRSVFFAASRSGTGSFPVPQLGVTLELNNPTLIGSAVANGAGQASITFRIPPSAAGRSVWIQACARNELSNWIADVIQ